MSTLFAFFHHVAAFTLVSALAVEFVLIRQELTLANARRLPIVDAVTGNLCRPAADRWAVACVLF